MNVSIAKSKILPVKEALAVKAISYLSFYRELSSRFHEIGSIFPSSRALAEVMTRPLNDLPGDRRILEVGPGTGPFTREILRKMRGGDHFTICEINETFLQQLKNVLTQTKEYRLHRERIEFIQGPVQLLRNSHADQKFDLIVCGLPFSIFAPEVADEIMSLFRNLLNPSGKLTFFEYWGMRDIFGFINTPKNRERLRAVDQVIERWEKIALTNGSVQATVCLSNFPPAKAREFCYLSESPAPH